MTITRGIRRVWPAAFNSVPCLLPTDALKELRDLGSAAEASGK